MKIESMLLLIKGTTGGERGTFVGFFSRQMLVGPDQPASAFRYVQLRGLGARGHKSSRPKRQKTPFRPTRLMLVAPGRAPSAFRHVQLRRVEARGHKLN